MSEMNDWNRKIIEEFRANGGKVSGPFEGAPLIILHTKGARSGQERLNPLMSLPDEGRYVIFASKGGAPGHPDWYFNLLANPDVEIEVGTERLQARATVADGPTRDRLYATQSQLHPQFAEYQQKTKRLIPVVILQPKS